jgi:hypothetical protein
MIQSEGRVDENKDKKCNFNNAHFGIALYGRNGSCEK